MSDFRIKSKFKPAGDQIKAIDTLVRGIKRRESFQSLMGVTGSGKTFTMANVIEKINKPTLVIAHNKTLAAQLAEEYREFFPENSVQYFVSYYDYYQPEAYIMQTDTYIEKEAQINEEIERLRHASTQALLTRRDVIIVASVSCIYGLGSPVEYERVHKRIKKGMDIDRNIFIRQLVDIFFERTNADLTPGNFRVIGNIIEVMPVNEKIIVRLELDEGKIGNISKIDSVTRKIINPDMSDFFLFPAKHFITSEDEKERAVRDISLELEKQLAKFKREGKILEADRLKRRTNYDIALIREIGYCNGIENYSRHFDGREKGEPPHTLLSYFPKKKDGTPDFLTVIDESHVTVPQVRGMFEGDASRKRNLIEHGFRLPSAADNRPLIFEEFEERIGQTIFTSATLGPYELEKSTTVAQQVIRPTGLIDPEIIVRGIVEKGKYKGQIDDFTKETEKVVKKGFRVIATTLTKKMAEDLSEFLKGKGMKAEYLHSDIATLERIEILTNLRKGKFDIIVGVNLLREGLDLPEVALIGILDADKEGFLRSETALIQIIGRAARNIYGRVILYADKITGSMERAIDETNRRREIQVEYNKKHKITPKTIVKKISDITDQFQTKHQKAVDDLLKIDEGIHQLKVGKIKKLVAGKEKQMNAAAKILDFETAAILRDEILKLNELLRE
jgi:excinuclease ABC subunit B